MQLFIKLHALRFYYSVYLNTALVIYKAQNNPPPNCIQRLNQIKPHLFSLKKAPARLSTQALIRALVRVNENNEHFSPTGGIFNTWNRCNTCGIGMTRN